MQLTIADIRQQVQRFQNLARSLREERERRQARLDEIESALEELGIDLDRVGRPATEPQRELAATVQAGPNGAAEQADRPRRLRWTELLSAREFVIHLVDEHPGMTTRQINEAWAKDQRRGSANNTLGTLVREGRLLREENPDGRGSCFHIAPDTGEQHDQEQPQENGIQPDPLFAKPEEPDFGLPF